MSSFHDTAKRSGPSCSYFLVCVSEHVLSVSTDSMAKRIEVATSVESAENNSIFNDRDFRGCYAVWVLYLIFCGVVISYEKIKEERACRINDIEYYLCFLPFPVFNSLHALYVYIYNTYLSHMARLLHCLGGMVSCVASAGVAIWIAKTLWSCSTALIFSVLCGCVSVSIFWSLYWAKCFRDIFTTSEDPEYVSALLLIFRCVCIPMAVKKALLCLPFAGAAVYFYVQLNYLSDPECVTPLFLYVDIAALLCIFWFIVCSVIVFYGRVLLVASQSDDYEALQPRFSLSLFTLWFALAGVDIFGILWAIIGVVWIYEASGHCNYVLIDVATAANAVLFLFSIGTALASCLIKVESCFPVATDPTLLHSTRSDSISNSEDITSSMHRLVVGARHQPYDAGRNSDSVLSECGKV